MPALLDLKDAADALGCDEVAVKRLVARRRIAATQLGDAIKFRMTQAALDEYVSGGAPDFQTPPFDSTGFRWRDLRYIANQFFNKFSAAIGTEPATDATIKAVLARQFKGEQASAIDIEAPINSAMRQLMDSPAPWPTGVLARDAAIEDRIKTFREAFLVYYLREDALDKVKPRLWESRLSALYASPDEYAANVARALERTKERMLMWKEDRTLTYQLESPKVAGGKTITTREQRVMVRYLVSFSKLYEGDLDRRIPDIAF